MSTKRAFEPCEMEMDTEDNELALRQRVSETLAPQNPSSPPLWYAGVQAGHGGAHYSHQYAAENDKQLLSIHVKLWDPKCLNRRDNKGRTPWDYAHEAGHHDLAMWILLNGGLPGAVLEARRELMQSR